MVASTACRSRSLRMQSSMCSPTQRYHAAAKEYIAPELLGHWLKIIVTQTASRDNWRFVFLTYLRYLRCSTPSPASS